jgi:exopolysaccharide production protein ExoQ
MRILDSPRVRSLFLVLLLSILLAGDAWRYAAGWWVYGVIAAGLAAFAIAMLIIHRDRWRLGGLPYPLIAFLVLATASIAWSFYPAASALGLLSTWLVTIVAVWLAVGYRWQEILRGLGITLRIVLGLSIVFELFVAVVLRRPILPLFVQPGVDYSSYEKIPKMLYWSRNELFEVFDEGRIQGIVGNSNHLGMMALLGVIVFAIQFADRSVRRPWALGWLVLAGLTLLLTRSATVTIALAAVVVAVLATLLVRRATTPRARRLTFGAIVATLAAGAALVIAFQSTLLGLLGKSSDFTGRIGIWEKVIDLAMQRPAFGWGWVGYWMPWAPPFDDLAFRNGVRQLQAHNAWLDIWLQLGILGLIVIAALVIPAAIRAWTFSIDRPRLADGGTGPYTAWSLLPLAIIVVLLVQSIAESRLITEYGWALLVVVAAKTKAADSIEREDARAWQ